MLTPEMGHPPLTSAVARRTDPPTSHAAAATVSGISRLQAQVLALFHELGPMTDGDLIDSYALMVEVGDYPPASSSGIRTRRHELTALGRLADTGRRSLTPAGRQTIVWGIPQ